MKLSNPSWRVVPCHVGTSMMLMAPMEGNSFSMSCSVPLPIYSTMPYLSGCCLHCSLLVDYSRGWWRKFKNVWEKSWILGRSTRPTQKNGSQNYHQLPNGKIDAWKFFHNNCHQYITVPTVFGPKWIEIPEQTGLASHWTRLQSVSRVHHITYLTKGNSSKK